MSGTCSEISETLKRRYINIYCLQEVRWKGQGAKISLDVRFLWSRDCGCNSFQVVNLEGCGC